MGKYSNYNKTLERILNDYHREGVTKWVQCVSNKLGVPSLNFDFIG